MHDVKGTVMFSLEGRVLSGGRAVYHVQGTDVSSWVEESQVE